VWRHWVAFLSTHFTTVRYDERGCGLSQRAVDDVSSATWARDLEDVIDAAAPSGPFVLLGISQGAVAALAYAVKYPERVSHLVIYGGYARGWAVSGNANQLREGNALVDLTEVGWGRPNPLYRRLLTQRFLPHGSEEQLRWMDELCARTVAPDMAARLLRSRGEANAMDWISQVRVPTLVLHADKDRVSAVSEGQLIAASIPNAQFVPLSSYNHILLEDEPAWQVFTQAVLEFTGVRAHAQDARFALLTDRERSILEQMCTGRTNAEIGKALFISDKTVRNHLTRVFEKLGVSTRAQAIVTARDLGFQPPAR
jgi:pimeloyl-ACP methyl ester carboxylesterase/DNA-binding CsgD family transcriptional regulator